MRSRCPATIQALLRSRLDVLSLAERSVLERGSVVGQVFYRDAVAELGSEPDLDDLGRRLERLALSRFVRPDVSPFEGDEAWAFVHLLVRDATYEGMLKRARSELHERFARWLRGRAGDRLPEFEEIVGYHLEQAYVLRRELGPLDDARRADSARGRRRSSSDARSPRLVGSNHAAAVAVLPTNRRLPPRRAGRATPRARASLETCYVARRHRSAGTPPRHRTRHRGRHGSSARAHGSAGSTSGSVARDSTEPLGALLEELERQTHDPS